MQLTRYTIALAALLAVCGSAMHYYFLHHGATQEQAPAPAPPSPLPHADITVQEVVLREMSSLRKSGWVIAAQNTDIFNQTKKITCHKVSCTVLQDRQEVAALQADKTLVDQETKNIFFEGPVRGKISDLEIEGQNFSYCFSQNAISSKEKTTYKNADFKITAGSSRIDLHKKKAFLSGGVRTEFASQQ